MERKNFKANNVQRNRAAGAIAPFKTRAAGGSACIVMLCALAVSTLFKHKRIGLGTGPQNYPIVVVALQSIIRNRIQFAVVDACPIAAGRNHNSRSSRNVLSTSSDHDNSGRDINAAFIDMVPIVKVVVRRRVMDFEGNRDIHIPHSADASRTRCKRSQSVNSHLVSAIPQIAVNRFILQVELEVIGEEFKVVRL